MNVKPIEMYKGFLALKTFKVFPSTVISFMALKKGDMQRLYWLYSCFHSSVNSFMSSEITAMCSD